MAIKFPDPLDDVHRFRRWVPRTVDVVVHDGQEDWARRIVEPVVPSARLVDLEAWSAGQGAAEDGAEVLFLCQDLGACDLARLLKQAPRPGRSVFLAGLRNATSWRAVRRGLTRSADLDPAGLAALPSRRTLSRGDVRSLLKAEGWSLVEEAAAPGPPPFDGVATILAQGLGAPEAEVRADLATDAWVFRAVAGARHDVVTVIGLGLAKIAGVTEARVDYPLAAMAATPGARVGWGSGAVSVPRPWPPGVFLLHRQFVNTEHQRSMIEGFVEKGWIALSDMDDDPRHWPAFINSDFYAYRAVHAVTVSTEPMADMIRQWNPNVQVFPNAITELPDIAPATPKNGRRVRVFFGALNRGADWAGLSDSLIQATLDLGDKVEFVVVHDQAFFDALPARVAKTFHPTLSHPDYMKVMAECDLALLPLSDTPFNRLKSDLKFIECCAAGVTPICSPVVYGDEAEHHDIGIFVQTAEAWGAALSALVQDPDEIARRRALGLDYVRRRRMHAHQVEPRTAYYLDLLARRDDLESQRRERLSNWNRTNQS